MIQNTFFNGTSDGLAPGVQPPLNEIILDDFKQDNEWMISGGTMSYDISGATLTLTENFASISKKFTYSTWKYSDLNIKIVQISQGYSWELLV